MESSLGCRGTICFTVASTWACRGITGPVAAVEMRVLSFSSALRTCSFSQFFPHSLLLCSILLFFPQVFPKVLTRQQVGPSMPPRWSWLPPPSKFLPPTLSTFLQTEMKEASGHSWVWSVLKCNLPFLSTHGDGYNFHLHWRSYNYSA